MSNEEKSRRDFRIGDRVQSNVHGGIGIVRNIVEDRATGEPLLVVTDGKCGWPVLASEATFA